ncbi:acyl carrier protein [Humibacillus xanthopallidus]|uniref:Acyl carrier protein n=1 Tax=Humibacillus xanthopallidus TaxID=412689 RepID=A0A543PPK3_9MICO|nr:acyl carrier protein [Humibacillus xanthopallidus]TQN46005.1 acyl carrier protein [Humibacillus xanthopallidus]
MTTTPSQGGSQTAPTAQTAQGSPRELLETTLREIVPDASLDGVSGDADLRETFELDSLDFVELVERLGKRAGFRIEDDDADQLRTINTATAFLSRGMRRTG